MPMTSPPNTSGAVLVADVGGTNARFAVAVKDADGRPQLRNIRQFQTEQFDSLEAAAQAYLAEVGEPLSTAVMAVASAVTSDRVKITNNPWTFSIRALGESLKLPGLEVINDFTATSLALPFLHGDDIEPAGAAVPEQERNSAARSYAVLGPGTGLGVGALLQRPGRNGVSTVVMESEGGHASFAPVDDYELEILRRLLQEFGRVSWERLISSIGMLNLYRAVCAIEGSAAELDSPAAVTEAAASDKTGAAARTIEKFCEILGGFAGDIALISGASDGV